MSRSVEQILSLYQQRRTRLDPMHQAALRVKEAYYGETILAIPELDRADKPLVANLLYQGGEQRAMRVASTMPNVVYPSKRPGQPLADKRAQERRLVNLCWWDEDRFAVKMRKRARHMVFYASCPVIIRPDMREGRPTWQVRNPLHTFPPELDTGELVPPDCIFTFYRSGPWLERAYPEKISRLNRKKGTGDESYMCIEYIDDEDYVLAVVGEKDSGPGYDGTASRGEEVVELERTPNKAGKCTAVVPGRIGLEAARGEFDGVLGLWQMSARLMALATIGTQRGVFPEMWLVDGPQSEARIVTHADPMHGITGHVTGGTIQPIHPQLDQMAMNLLDRLERGFRIESGVPAELGGESTSNIRTGRRGDAVLSAVLDFPIQEEQQLLEVSIREENKLAIAIDKAYFPRAKTFILSGTSGEITYKANDLFESDQNFVRYARAGVDAQGLTVEIGQRIGMGVMSKQTGMEIDPLIEDPPAEIARITVEAMRAGLQQSIIAMGANPDMAVPVARIVKGFNEGTMTVEDAVLSIHDAIQQEQARQAAQQAQQAPPGAPPGAEAQPGLASPTIAPAPEGLSNLTGLLADLHRGQTAGAVPPPELQRTG